MGKEKTEKENISLPPISQCKAHKKLLTRRHHHHEATLCDEVLHSVLQRGTVESGHRLRKPCATFVRRHEENVALVT